MNHNEIALVTETVLYCYLLSLFDKLSSRLFRVINKIIPSEKVCILSLEEAEHKKEQGVDEAELAGIMQRRALLVLTVFPGM